MQERLDIPQLKPKIKIKNPSTNDFGQVSETIARFLGTPRFLMWLSIFCAAWIAWNSLAPEELRFDSSNLGFTALTLVLSLQASYAAPLILLAENRQLDRDRVSSEQDRKRAERSLSDTEFLAREILSIKLALEDVATRDFMRNELKELLKEERENAQGEPANSDGKPSKKVPHAGKGNEEKVKIKLEKEN